MPQLSNILSTKFQSPLLRGNVRDMGKRIDIDNIQVGFSPLFFGAMFATQKKTVAARCHASFSPLFFGAMFATIGFVESHRICFSFSPLFFGAMFATFILCYLVVKTTEFQSPLLRGNVRDW